MARSGAEAHIKNICHHVGHPRSGRGHAVRRPDRVSCVPDSGVVKNSARDPVRTSAQRRADAPALIAGDTVITWAELDERVDLAARRLAVGTAPGDRVALVLGNT